MKRFTALLVTVIMLFSLTSCVMPSLSGGGASRESSKAEKSQEEFDEPEEPEEESEEPEQKESKGGGYGLNDTIETPTYKVTALEVKTIEGHGIYTPEDGNMFLGVKFRIENVSGEEQTVSTLLLFDTYADGERAGSGFMAELALSDEESLSGNLAPGGSREGYYGIEAPIGTTELEIHVMELFSSEDGDVFRLSVG